MANNRPQIKEAANMKYAIIDQTTGDWFESVFDSKDEAISRADYEWAIMSQHDKKRRTAFFVASCKVDEDGFVDYDSIDPIKEYI